MIPAQTWLFEYQRLIDERSEYGDISRFEYTLNIDDQWSDVSTFHGRHRARQNTHFSALPRRAWLAHETDDSFYSFRPTVVFNVQAAHSR
jgi:hypothetical protein